MKKIRTIITDDEPMARMRVRRLLAKDPEIEVVAECRDGQEAREAVRTHKPDLLFLDVEMPGINGFELLELVDPNYMPFVVFVTAYDQYASRAFDVDAVDFLLKPFSDKRFTASLARAKRSMELRQSTALTGRLMDLMRDYIHVHSSFTEVFAIRERGREIRVAADDLVYIRAKGNYLHLYTKERHHVYRATLNTLETELDPKRFLRIHRSFIVNLDHVANWRYTGNNEFILTMANGDRLMSGRAFKEPVAKALQEQLSALDRTERGPGAPLNAAG